MTDYNRKTHRRSVMTLPGGTQTPGLDALHTGRCTGLMMRPGWPGMRPLASGLFMFPEGEIGHVCYLLHRATRSAITIVPIYYMVN